MNDIPAVKEAAENEEIRIACAYSGHVPEDILAQLPKGFEGRQYVMKLVDGKMVEFREGFPEKIIGALLPTPVDTSSIKPGESCPACEPEAEPESGPSS